MTHRILDLAAALADRYRIERELGAGGMATVYLAHDSKHNRLVAIKVLKPELAAILGAERFLAEIKVTANLQHPNLLPLFDSGEANGFLYYVMPYVEGETLRARLQRERQLPVEETVRMVTLLASALDYAHARGVIHRDLKPENILLQAGQPVIADFGIALAVAQAGGSRVTETGLSLGTPHYMSPEQAAGDRELDARSDQYALAAVTYEMLSGEPPHTGPTAQVIIARVMTERPRSLRATRAEVPPAVDKAVTRGLAKSPADRFSSCGALATALAGSSAPANRRYLPIAVAGMLLALGVVGWLVFRPARNPASHGQALAVLPFTNEGGDTAQAYLAYGITDAVQVFLQKVPGLKVIGQASASAAAGAEATAQEIGRRLGVDQFLRGTVRRRGDSVRVSAELVATSDGHTVWAQRFDRPFDRIYSLDDDIAEPLVAELKLVLSGTSLANARAGHTRNAAAYDQYLLGRHALDRMTETALWAAIAHFDSAIAIDSGFALAYTGIASAWTWLADEYVAPDSAYHNIKDNALKALQRDSLVADAHTLLGMGMFTQDHDMTSADREYRRGLMLDSNSAVAVEYYANYLTLFSRPGDCSAQADRAVALDPLSGFAAFVRVTCLYSAGRYDQAIREDARMKDLQPGLVYFDDYGAASLRQLKRYDEAVAAYRRADSLSNKPLFGLGVTFAQMGLRDSALRVAHDLEALYRRRYVSPDMIAYIYANLPAADDRDQAFRWMSESLKVNSLLALCRDQMVELAPLRGDPRYRAQSSQAHLH